MDKNAQEEIVNLVDLLNFLFCHLSCFSNFFFPLVLTCIALKLLAQKVNNMADSCIDKNVETHSNNYVSPMMSKTAFQTTVILK